jgi:cytochrome b5
MGIGLYAVVLIGGLVAFGAYQYMQQQQAQKA